MLRLLEGVKTIPKSNYQKWFEVHINAIWGIIIYITEYKTRISYFENHDSTLMLVLYYVYMSPLPTLVHIVAKGILFQSVLLSMLLNYKKNCLDVSPTGSFPFPMSMHTHILILYHPYGNGDSLNLDLNGIEGVIIHLSVPENYVFRHYYQ